MKNYVSAIAAVLLFSACSKSDDPHPKEQETPITLSVQKVVVESYDCIDDGARTSAYLKVVKYEDGKDSVIWTSPGKFSAASYEFSPNSPLSIHVTDKSTVYFQLSTILLRDTFICAVKSFKLSELKANTYDTIRLDNAYCDDIGSRCASIKGYVLR